MKATIHSHEKQWSDAEIIGVVGGKYDRPPSERVLLVKHSDFNYDIVFYAKPDAQNRHFKVGDSALWLTIEDELH